MNYLQLVQRLKREAGRSGANITTVVGLANDDQFLADQVSEAWLEIQRAPHGWNWMRANITAAAWPANQTNATGASLVLPATNFGRWLAPATEDYIPMVATAANPTQRWPLRFMPWETFRRQFVLTVNAAAQPVYYSIASDERIWLGPAPIEAVQLYASYHRAPVPLALDADGPDMATEYHMAVVWRALVEVASFDAAPEVFSRATANWTNAENDLLDRYGPKLGFANNTLR